MSEPWPDEKLVAEMLEDAHHTYVHGDRIMQKVECHIMALLDRVRKLEAEVARLRAENGS